MMARACSGFTGQKLYDKYERRGTRSLQRSHVKILGLGPEPAL
jgi:hypothetical protein